jgi:hypothetical protein
MKLRLSILLLAAALAASPAAGQTIKSLGFNTTNGQVVYSGTNPLTFTNPLAFGDTTNTASIRTNLGLGATNYPAFRGLEITDGDTLYINPYNINADTFGLVLNFEERNFAQDGATVFEWSTNSFTVTPNATLNGVNNTAPSQTADSGSSLMTRDLVDNAAAYDASFGPTYAAYSQTTNSATAVARLVAGLGVQTGSATNGRSCVALGENFWNNASFSGAVLPSTKAIDFYLHGVTIASLANTNWVARVIFGQGQPTTRIPPAAGEDAVTSRSWGVEFYNNGTDNVYCLFWHNGTTLFKASEQVLAGSGSSYIAALKFSQDGDGGISFTQNTSSAGRIPNTPTFSTNVVFGGGYFGRYILIEAAGNTNQAQPGSGAGILTRAQYIRYVP